jgi:hypothetical protein
MDAVPLPAAADALIRLLRTAMAPDGTQSFNQLVLYTSFGVLRGRIGHSFAQEIANPDHSGAQLSGDLIELNAVTIEHFSNHLANATFERFYVRLNDVKGFSFVG